MSNLGELIECFEYLDGLRDDGNTNMWGAAPFLERERGLSISDARSILQKWMDTFDKDTPAQERATKAWWEPSS